MLDIEKLSKEFKEILNSTSKEDLEKWLSNYRKEKRAKVRKKVISNRREFLLNKINSKINGRRNRKIRVSYKAARRKN